MSFGESIRPSKSGKVKTNTTKEMQKLQKLFGKYWQKSQVNESADDAKFLNEWQDSNC